VQKVSGSSIDVDTQATDFKMYLIEDGTSKAADFADFDNVAVYIGTRLVLDTFFINTN